MQSYSLVNVSDDDDDDDNDDDDRFYRAALNADAFERWEFCLSVSPSVRPSNACIVTKQKKDLSKFMHMKDHLA